MACAISWSVVRDEEASDVVDPVEEEEDEVDDDAEELLLVLESPVTPIWERACRIEATKPPPGGGGGGIPDVSVVLLVDDVSVDVELVEVDCELLAALNCANQVLMLEMLLMVTGVSSSTVQTCGPYNLGWKRACYCEISTRRTFGPVSNCYRVLRPVSAPGNLYQGLSRRPFPGAGLAAGAGFAGGAGLAAFLGWS